MFKKGESEHRPPADTLPESVFPMRVGGISGMATQVYPSDLNDDEWTLLAPLIPPAKPGGRPRSVNIRRILNGLFYILRSGCAWVSGRYLPREYGPWQTVYWYFRQ